ncbi:hypothetical protein [Aquimarina mytili]|uniref:Uncharacterized protein n=1 Tax=Aquimarina mytili TaxID=874423 RepID=A0A937A376_9FLAO|nr:hypothetical protein [Aquimarina mytili]MBL0686041.1 hypothetical protein [Aquimarina mytili]
MEKITLQEYRNLSKKEQEVLLTEKGKHLDSLKEGYYGYALYALDRFFVEVVYASSSNRIVSIKSFNSGKRLDFYVSGRKLKP